MSTGPAKKAKPTAQRFQRWCPKPTHRASEDQPQGRSLLSAPTIADRTGPLYLRIVDALASDIGCGRLRRGQALPTHRTLAKTLGIDLTTVTRAYAEARQRGLVEAGSVILAASLNASAVAKQIVWFQFLTHVIPIRPYAPLP
jgi:hypothetical protein